MDIVDEHDNIVASIFVQETGAHNILLKIERVEEREVLIQIR